MNTPPSFHLNPQAPAGDVLMEALKQTPPPEIPNVIQPVLDFLFGRQISTFVADVLGTPNPGHFMVKVFDLIESSTPPLTKSLTAAIAIATRRSKRSGEGGGGWICADP
jgi:hypothetical protein